LKVTIMRLLLAAALAVMALSIATAAFFGHGGTDGGQNKSSGSYYEH
jgi:hypothetical protein